MKFITLFVGICLVQVQCNVNKEIQVQWDLVRQYPNHPYLHLRKLSKMSNEFLDDYNKQLALEQSAKGKIARKQTEESLKAFSSKSTHVADTSVSTFGNTMTTMQTELKDLAKSGPNGEQCLDQHKERQNEIEEKAWPPLISCQMNSIKQAADIIDVVTDSYISVNELIGQLKSLHASCCDQYDDDKNIIQCNLIKSQEIIKDIDRLLFEVGFTNQTLLEAVREHYHCSWRSINNTQQDYSLLKMDVESCIKKSE